MSRYIDEEWLKAFFEADKGKSRNTPIDSLLALIGDAPSIEIVRCHECNKLHDCRNDSWHTGVIERGYIGWCNRTSRLGDVDYVKFNDFCSYGERKADADK